MVNRNLRSVQRNPSNFYKLIDIIMLLLCVHNQHTLQISILAQTDSIVTYSLVDFCV
jgi:hypothetical protein